MWLLVSLAATHAHATSASVIGMRGYGSCNRGPLRRPAPTARAFHLADNNKKIYMKNLQNDGIKTTAHLVVENDVRAHEDVALAAIRLDTRLLVDVVLAFRESLVVVRR